MRIESNRGLYSFILIGALLPDLIDKPIGKIMLAESLSNGRLFAHSFLFIFFLLFGLIANCSTYTRIKG